MLITGGKSKSKAKRKPLRDVSNGGFKPSISNSVMKKSNPQNQQEESITTCAGGRCTNPLDRLLLVHSDLSVLIHQIDELVVQALEKKVRNEKEIESFAHELYEMQNTLKPWVSRFQKLLPTHATGSENQLETSLASMKITSKETNKALVSPYKEKLDFLVSPSPLVSWRAECAADGGRNLFLLTPLPKPTPFSSRLKKSSKSVFKNVAMNEKATVERVFSSPENKMIKRNDPIIVSTPYMKMSPPKSCILLEPPSECYNKNNNDSKNPTMDPVGVGVGGGGGSGDSEHLSSSVLPSGHLALKYPEIFGIRTTHKLGNARKMVEASPNWCVCMSPPKTCVLLEPSDIEVKDVEIFLPKAGGVPSIASCNEVIESTPMCKDLDTTILKGKRAGENTLKKELWMRFEAATAHGFHFKASHDQQNAANSGTNKGFLDLLEEASCDNTNSID